MNNISHRYSQTPIMEPPPLLSFTNVTAAIFALFLFLYALFRFSRTHRKRLPPEAGGAWPLIGHLHLLAGGTEPGHTILANMEDAYGPIFTIRLGIHKSALVVSSWEIARECLITHDKIFASRPKLVALKLLGYDFALLGFASYGPYWRHIRKIATQELLSNLRLELLQHIRVSEVYRSIRELYDFCVNTRNNGGGKAVVEMKKWFGDISLNTIFRMVVGKRFTTAFDGVDNERYRKVLRDFTELAGMIVPSDAFPYLKWLDLGGYEKAMKKTAKELDQVFDKWLKERQQQKRISGDQIKAENDFMDVMMSSLEDEEEFFGYDTDTIIKATCLSMILGGSDTTTVTMTWALSLLLNNQEALKKVQHELEEKVGRERQVKESDMKNLVYLQAIVKETLRLYPASSLSLPREAMEDCSVAGYHIPMGTQLIVNLHKLQRDPVIWKDPNEFRPERFLTTQKEFDVRGQNPRLIPFGNGRRICPGISFALQLMNLTLANLLHGFEIGTPSDEAVDMKERFGLTSIKATPLNIVLTPRLSAQVFKNFVEEEK